jgi:GNAT superfamily N-acetyltransferase
MEAVLRVAIEADKPFLRWLEETTMRDYAVALWGTWRPSPEEGATYGTRIVTCDGEDAGCVATTRQADHIWINKLYIAPEYQRRGLGAAVLRLVISEGAASNLPVRLGVLTTNPAIAFYIREGLRVYEETPERIFLTS